MTRTQELAERVERGAALLDEKKPGWAKLIRGAMLAGIYNFGTWKTCIAGTLEMVKWQDASTGKDHRERLLIVLNGDVLCGVEEAARHGFCSEREDDELNEDLEVLEAEWALQVTKREGISV